MRKGLRVLALCLIPLMLSGCWSYRSLSDMDIVMGMSVDRDPETGGFLVVNEIADLSKMKDSGPTAKRVDSKGKTVLDAVREAKRRLHNRLYYGNMHILAVGEALARNDGIAGLVDWVMRDAEGRETINLVVAKGCQASDILKLKGIDQAIVSLEMDSIISSDNKTTSSTIQTELYKAYNMLLCPGVELALPAFHLSENDGQRVAEADGIAVFKGDELAGYLSAEESKYFLIADNRCQGGILAVAVKGSGPPNASLEIASSKAKTSFKNENGRLSFKIETETNAYLAETSEDIDVLDEEQIEALQEEAGRRLEAECGAVLQKVQKELQSDILGLGSLVHQRDAALWHRLEGQWDSIFPTVSIQVSCKVNIKNTAFIKTKETIKK